MQDKEIVKAYEYCSQHLVCHEDCPFYNSIGYLPECNKIFCDLIHQLQAENEQLKAEIERLKEQLDHSIGIDKTKNDGCFPFD